MDSINISPRRKGKYVTKFLQENNPSGTPTPLRQGNLKRKAKHSKAKKRKSLVAKSPMVHDNTYRGTTHLFSDSSDESFLDVDKGTATFDKLKSKRPNPEQHSGVSKQIILKEQAAKKLISLNQTKKMKTTKEVFTKSPMGHDSTYRGTTLLFSDSSDESILDVDKGTATFDKLKSKRPDPEQHSGVSKQMILKEQAAKKLISLNQTKKMKTTKERAKKSSKIHNDTYQRAKEPNSSTIDESLNLESALKKLHPRKLTKEKAAADISFFKRLISQDEVEVKMPTNEALRKSPRISDKYRMEEEVTKGTNMDKSDINKSTSGKSTSETSFVERVTLNEEARERDHTEGGIESIDHDTYGQTSSLDSSEESLNVGKATSALKKLHSRAIDFEGEKEIIQVRRSPRISGAARQEDKESERRESPMETAPNTSTSIHLSPNKKVSDFSSVKRAILNDLTEDAKDANQLRRSPRISGTPRQEDKENKRRSPMETTRQFSPSKKSSDFSFVRRAILNDENLVVEDTNQCVENIDEDTYGQTTSLDSSEESLNVSKATSALKKLHSRAIDFEGEKEIFQVRRSPRISGTPRQEDKENERRRSPMETTRQFSPSKKSSDFSFVRRAILNDLTETSEKTIQSQVRKSPRISDKYRMEEEVTKGTNMDKSNINKSISGKSTSDTSFVERVTSNEETGERDQTDGVTPSTNPVYKSIYEVASEISRRAEDDAGNAQVRKSPRISDKYIMEEELTKGTNMDKSNINKSTSGKSTSDTSFVERVTSNEETGERDQTDGVSTSTNPVYKSIDEVASEISRRAEDDAGNDSDATVHYDESVHTASIAANNNENKVTTGFSKREYELHIRNTERNPVSNTPSTSAQLQLGLQEFLNRFQRKKKKMEPLPQFKNVFPSTSSAPPKKKSPRPKKVIKKPGGKSVVSYPHSTTKQIFTHFCRHRVHKDALEEVYEFTSKFFENLSEDLFTMMSPKDEKIITARHVYLLMRRLGLVSTKGDLYQLVRDYLPLEYWDILIPTRYPHGVVRPKDVLEAKK